MRRREHLSGNAEGHSHTCKVQAACLHSGDNRHDDGHMSLGHTGEHADDEADAGNNNRHGQRRALKGCDDFVQHLGNCKNLDKVQNAEHVEEHLHVNRSADNFLEPNLTLSEAQDKEQSCSDDAHANGSVHIEENDEDEGEHNRRKRKPQILPALLVFILRAAGFLDSVIFNRADEYEPADAEHEHGEPAKMHDKFAVGDTGNIAGHNHTRNNRAGKFKDVAEPEVDSRLVLARKPQTLACFLHDGRRKTCAAERGQQAEKGGHDGEGDAVAGKNSLQCVHHACECTAGAQLDFQAHYKVQRKKNVIGTRQAQRFDKGLRKIVQLRCFHEPDKKSACEHTGTNGDVLAQHEDNDEHGDGQKYKYIHELPSFSFSDY